MFFRDERDRDFLAACESVREANKHLSASEIAKIAVYSPTQSFYLTTRELAKIISRIRKGEVVRKANKDSIDLYNEISMRISSIENSHLMPCNVIARIIDSQTAPRFYISEQRAVTLYYECLNKQLLRKDRLTELRNKRKQINELRRNNPVYSRNHRGF